MEYKDKVYWRCSRKNIWDKLREYIVYELELELQDIVEPCDFYQEYSEGEKFKCDDLIYNHPRKNIFQTGKCLVNLDSDDDI